MKFGIHCILSHAVPCRVSFMIFTTCLWRNRAVITIQRAVRGWVWRYRFLEMKRSAIVIQKTWKAYYTRQRYQIVSRRAGDRVIVRCMWWAAIKNKADKRFCTKRKSHCRNQWAITFKYSVANFSAFDKFSSSGNTSSRLCVVFVVYLKQGGCVVLKGFAAVLKFFFCVIAT